MARGLLVHGARRMPQRELREGHAGSEVGVAAAAVEPFAGVRGQDAGRGEGREAEHERRRPGRHQEVAVAVATAAHPQPVIERPGQSWRGRTQLVAERA
eukprot:g40383.t1